MTRRATIIVALCFAALFGFSFWRTVARSPGGLNPSGRAILNSPNVLGAAQQVQQDGLIDIRRFGAAGDGVTDDTRAIQAACDAVEAIGGGTLLVPAGTYVINGDLRVNQNGRSGCQVIIEGVGPGSQIRQRAKDANGLTIGRDSFADDEGYAYMMIRDLHFVGPGSGTGHGIAVVHSRGVTIEHCYIDSFGGDGIYTDDAWANRYIGNRIQSNGGHGISLNGNGNACQILCNHLLGHATAAKAGVYVVGCDSVWIAGNDFEGNGHGVYISNSEAGGLTVIDGGNHFESNVTSGITVMNASGGGNIYGVAVRNNFLYKNPVVMGTDASGTTICGGELSGNHLNDAAVTFIGGGRIIDFSVGDNTLAGTARYGAMDGMLPNSANLGAHFVMPLYRDTPTQPWGAGDTKGVVGDMRWAQSYVSLKTANGWARWQLNYTADATTVYSLPRGTTPSAAGQYVCRTANTVATTVTSITKGYPSQQLIIVGADGGKTTFRYGPNLQLASGVNFAVANNDVLHLLCVNGTQWIEVSRSNNSAGPSQK